MGAPIARRCLDDEVPNDREMTMMEVHGTRFGTLSFDSEDIIQLADGLLGFPLSKRYIMFPYSDDSSFFWLQSLDEPEISFIVINPFDFFANLEFEVTDEDARSIGLQKSEDVEIFSLVTIPEGQPEDMRTNLAGPVIVNTRTRQGKQVLLSQYSARQSLIPKEFRAQAREQAVRELRQPRMMAV
ncbi:MAG: flagellar assembly protein FliW [Magnetococcales bacterium]|nr:flagellar assembly protein FliW [Magnetococcales bacterium]MBF0149270.1 flagellar assembly protein FliW [Magnetococcales bacterium]MBF0348013.1 flagellar assembly protein FliW [Magnetococcales bacterium]MBF0632178.1 flagellar assembly protein FliW [Magnetococcales bacterium]